jgi:hypothetical protein
MVNVNCFVRNCVSNNRSYPYLKFYKLPKDKKRRRRWKRLSRNTRQQESRWTSICRLHFEDGWKRDFYTDPSIFPWSEAWPNVVESYNNHVGKRFAQSQAEEHTYAKRPKLMEVPVVTTRKAKSVHSSNASRRALISVSRLVLFFKIIFFMWF